MAFTQADLDRINRAIATGELSIEKDGKKITYRSMGDLIKARDAIYQDLARQGLAAGQPRATVGYIARR